MSSETIIGECYDNVECYYDVFFRMENLNEELLKLQKDICKKIPKDLWKLFLFRKIWLSNGVNRIGIQLVK